MPFFITRQVFPKETFSLWLYYSFITDLHSASDIELHWSSTNPVNISSSKMPPAFHLADVKYLKEIERLPTGTFLCGSPNRNNFRRTIFFTKADKCLMF